jgi:Cellulase (glycosyl hydrolase family 5)
VLLAALLLACAPSDTVTDDVLAASRRLHADGLAIVDGAGEPVQLRGVNLGAWIFHETWMTSVDWPTWGRFRLVAQEQGYTDEVDAALRQTGETDSLSTLEAALAEELESSGLDEATATTAAAVVSAEAALTPSIYDDSDLPLRQLLETRFGTDGRDALLDTYMGAWVGPQDIDWLAGQGFNLVRIPMGFRALTTGSDLAPPTSLEWNEATFAHLDAVLAACVDNDVYAVLDIQESPGGHNDYSGEATLYSDPEMQALTVELWTELSRRYADHDEVAMYSLLAEPFSAPDMDTNMAMYDQLVDAIRDQGDDHLLVVHDGFLGMHNLPVAADMGWEGVVYSTHLFEWGSSSEADYDAIMILDDAIWNGAQEAQGVPWFIGSFSTMEDADWAYASATNLVEWYEGHGWSWSWWAYKRMDDPAATEVWGTTTGWGLRREPWEGFERPDVWRDDQDTLARKLAAYDGELGVNEVLVDALIP